MTFLGDRISESVSGETAAMSVGIYGPDLDAIDRVARAITSKLKQIPGAADVQFDDGAGVPALSVSLLPERLVLLGLRAAEVYDAINTAYAGTVVAQVYEGNQSLAVRVLLPDDVRSDPDGLRALPLKTASGRIVPLEAVAAIELESGRERVSHEKGQRRQVVTLNPDTADLTGFVATATDLLQREVPLPAGVFLEVGGNASEVTRAMRGPAGAFVAGAGRHRRIAVAGLRLLARRGAGADQRAIRAGRRRDRRRAGRRLDLHRHARRPV